MNDGILIVSSSESTTESLSALLKTEKPTVIETAPTGAAARRRMLQATWGTVLINAPLRDEMGDELAEALAAAGTASVILMVKNEIADEIGNRVERSGVLILPKPISRQLLFQTFRMAAVMKNRLAALQRENDKLKKRVEELRVVDRAKCALIQYRGLTEEEAHKFIEREAMDGRITRKQVAEELVRMFVE